ncbi:MAG: HAMP domain-containing histidine kinase [Saprospiraceae bacterium]|nr:HAMP domain-containing histidine kinase [Saprospiraceae bacterium]
MLKKAAFLSAIIFICLYSVQWFRTTYHLPEKQIEKYLDEQFHQDSTQINNITKTFASSGDLQYKLSKLDLSTSPFSVSVYSDDTLIWWNQQSLRIKNRTDKIIYKRTSEFNQLLTEFEVVLFDNSGKLNPKIYSSAGLSAGISPDYIGNNRKLNAGTISIPVKTQLSEKNQLIPSLAFIFLLIFLVSVNILALKKLQTKKSETLTFREFLPFILVWGFTRAAFFIPFIKDFFGGMDLFRNVQSGIFLNSSVADLGLNLIWASLAVFFTNLPYIKSKLNHIPAHLYTYFTGFITMVLFWILVYIIKDFSADTKLNLETDYLLMFNYMSLILIFLFILFLFLIFHFTQNLFEGLKHFSGADYKKYIYLFLGVATGFAGILVFPPDFPVWPLLVFVCAYILILDVYVESGEKKITYILWWLILLSGFLAVNLFFFGIRKDAAERKSFVNQYFATSDPGTAELISRFSDTLVSGDAFTKFMTLSYPEKLDEQDISNYLLNLMPEDDRLNDYIKTVKLFDNTGSSLFTNHFINYHKTVKNISTGQKLNDFVYYNPFETKYYLRFEIENNVHPNGPLLLIISFEKDDPNRKSLLNNAFEKYNFAVIQNDQILESNFPGEHKINLNDLENITADVINSEYSFVVSTPINGIRIISYKKISGLIKPISMFSFILTLSGFILILLTVLNTRFGFLPENISLKFGVRASLKTKIQSAIIILILSSFLIIGLMTAFYFKNLIEVNQNAAKREESNSIVRNIQSSIQNLDDEESAIRYLQSKLKEIAFIHNKEISLYDKNGNLYSTSARTDFERRMPFQIWMAIHDTSENKGSAVESYSDGVYRPDYRPLYYGNKHPFAYIGIHHKTVDSSTRSILDFLSTILNVYIFLFLIAGAIAITISNSITQPLSILAEKLKQFKLGRKHDPLEWKSNDEIGDLINDYNNLTVELQKSAEMLAKTERDMAWREMAKQVAHEIKNPLTPMKLSIQYLEKASKSNPERTNDLIPRVSATLIEQIDNLTQIANEFSNFATMPQANNEKIILNEIVETIHDLFRKRDDMDISLVEPIDELVVFADRNHLVRILNNLVKNAIQAIPENKRGKIEIELSQADNHALIRVTDNGTGIPDHMKEKVFAPNFTTKSSGTGLGLAISANMIESFNGKIYFETIYGTGTDFYISIPLMRSEDLYKDENRVVLD